MMEGRNLVDEINQAYFAGKEDSYNDGYNAGYEDGYEDGRMDAE